MKKTFVLASLILCLILTACVQGNTSHNEQSKVNDHASSGFENNQLGKPVVTNGIEITIKQNKLSEIINGKEKKNLYSFKVEGKNVSQTKQGLGAIDFSLKTTSGKMIKIDDSLAVFGDEIAKHKTISGEMYFSVSKHTRIAQLIYKPGDKVLASWNIK